jgi:hypothetical protein
MFEDYIQCCLESAKDKNKFKNFKNDPRYVNILEHANEQYGVLVYNYLKNNNPLLVEKKNLEKFCNLDIVGNPRFLLKIDGLEVSPTTLNYIKVLSILLKINFIKNQDSVCEIGVGYGGQAKIICDELELKKYDCVDLKETHALIKLYTKNYNLNLYSVANIPDTTWDLVISNFAFSECPKHIQDVYYEKIIKNSKKGFFTMNYISSIFGIESYSKEYFLNKLEKDNFKVDILEEYPKSHPNNCIIIFKKD